MGERTADITIARQTELAISRLDYLTILPSVATRFFSQLFELQLCPSDLTMIVESSPALAAEVFALLSEQGVKISAKSTSISDAIAKLPLRTIRDSFFAMKVSSITDDSSESLIQQLSLHAIAVACAAEKITQTAQPSIDPQLAYLAGLLHNIGNLALAQAMPRSLITIVDQAKTEKACLCDIQRRHLGTDYTILGKRLAQKWHFPQQVMLAIWLHKTSTPAISQNLPETEIAQVIQLADCISRKCEIGISGSFDPVDSLDAIAEPLSITNDQIEQIISELPEAVSLRTKSLGLDDPDAANKYCTTMHDAAAQLASDNSTLSQENAKLRTRSSHFDFTTEFLIGIDSTMSPLDIAESFASDWQKFYQTGNVCLLLNQPEMIEAVVVQNSSQIKRLSLNPPEEPSILKNIFRDDFAIVDADENLNWLFEQIDADFDIHSTKTIPLLSDGKVTGAIIFEFRYPVETGQLKEMFKATTFIAGVVLDLSAAWQKQQVYAEQFAQMITVPKIVEPQLEVPVTPQQEAAIEPEALITALAEMAAGAAHELNNPLSVIAGRSQLLAESESDPQKQRILKQIQTNANQLSSIIDDLMSYAQPQPPRQAQTSVKQIIEEAIQFTSQKTKVEHINSQIAISDDINDVYVDSAQIVSALANIFSNSLDSYLDSIGPVEVKADVDASGSFVELKISDLGCGMDERTLKKATQPFFSAKLAGRKRGMGLAYAERLIQLNNGKLDIQSKPAGGTTVTVSLPCK